MLTVLALALLQTQSQANPQQILPRRTYQPTVFNPGIDGGTNAGFSRGEFTPDGRLLIGFRRFPDEAYASKFRTALTAAYVHTDRIVGDADGNLVEFYDDTPSGGLHGSDFTFGEWSTVPADVEYAKIHFGYEWIDCAGTPAPLCVAPCTAFGSLAESVKLDTYYPVPDTWGSAQMTVCMRPLATANPYPSLGDGSYSVTGGYETYELWVVRTHYPDFLGTHECRNNNNGPLAQPSIPYSTTFFTSQEVRVTVDPSTGVIAKTVVAEHEPLVTRYPSSPRVTYSHFLTPGVTEYDWIRGIEPSITADGRLILFHGKGDNPLAQSGSAIVTYIFNLNPCDPDGWTNPRPITELPLLTDLQNDLGQQVLTLEQFQDAYRLFKNPVRMPRSSFSGGTLPGEPYASGEDVIGTYPWVSKDGSFWNAYSVEGTDAFDPVPMGGDPCNPPTSTRTKCAAYVCGDLTNGVIQHIDDPGINPTRHGGPWAWPRHQSFNVPFGCTEPSYPNSWGAISMSTGVSPGLWEFHFGSDLPVPSMDADERIPVMPLIVPTIDTYGEMRFEGADGDFTLYLACNESLIEDPAQQGADFPAFGLDPTTTPDSACYVDDKGTADPLDDETVTALCVLNDGAAFPQEVYLNGQSGTPDYRQASKDLRYDVGAQVLGTAEPFHESIGFKGQAIVMNQDGAIDVSGSRRLGDPDAPLDPVDSFSVQMFVKCLSGAYAPAGGTTELLEYGLRTASGIRFVAFRLDLREDGRFEAFVRKDWTNPPQVFSTETRAAAVDLNSELADPTDGWRHVAVTYQADASAGESRLRIYLDGLLEETYVHGAYLPVIDSSHPALSPYYIVGPGRSTAAPVTQADMSLVVDEVAVSRVRRTAHEIRRDAFVVPLPDGFDPWPTTEIPLPLGLDESAAKWPLDIDPDPQISVIGGQLFHSNTLSADPSDPLVDGSRSCATCHDNGLSFTDGVALQASLTGPGLLDFNSPTLLNMGMGTHRTFSGSAAKLPDQIRQPLFTGPEMGDQDSANLLYRIGQNPALATLFDPSFPLTEENVIDALAMFLLYQNAGTAEFDTSPLGLDPDEQHGRELFFGKARCFACHRGTNFSDDDFHNVRTVPAGSTIRDRFAVTGRAADRGKLKTPTLRNLNDTGPYFHDGSLTSLREVIDHYNNPFTGTGANPAGPTDRTLRLLGLTNDEKEHLEAFLRTLSE